MLEKFKGYDKFFTGKSCILLLKLNNDGCLEELFTQNRNMCNQIKERIKNIDNILWFGMTNNSEQRLKSCKNPNGKNSLLKSISKLLIDKDISKDTRKLSDTKKIIINWLNKNTEFYACLCSDFTEKEAETIKKNLIQTYKPPFNYKYNEAIFNNLLNIK